MLLFAATNPAIGRAGNGPITYAYDELGRLVGAVDGTGGGVQYTYDAVGNLTNITPKSAATLSVFTCTPSNGPRGMTVIIYGDGFSTTPSQNTVTFSGASATVSASTVATITTTVPSAAPIGPGTLQVNNSKGSASTNFTVTTN